MHQTQNQREPSCSENGRLRDRSPRLQIGYMRVSKSDGSQALDLQRDALVAAGVMEDHVYEDNASGRDDQRPGLIACLKALRSGDTLLVWKLDRLGRNLRQHRPRPHRSRSGSQGPHRSGRCY